MSTEPSRSLHKHLSADVGVALKRLEQIDPDTAYLLRTYHSSLRQEAGFYRRQAREVQEANGENVPGPHSPEGATIKIQRSPRSDSVIVTFDRLAIGNATPEQCQAVARLAKAEIAATTKPNRSVTYLSAPTLWTLPTTRAREAALIRELIRIEAGVFS